MGVRSAVGECLVGSDGVVDDAESVDFHVEGIAVADVAAEEVLVLHQQPTVLRSASNAVLRRADPASRPRRAESSRRSDKRGERFG